MDSGFYSNLYSDKPEFIIRSGTLAASPVPPVAAPPPDQQPPLAVRLRRVSPSPPQPPHRPEEHVPGHVYAEWDDRMAGTGVDAEVIVREDVQVYGPQLPTRFHNDSATNLSQDTPAVVIVRAEEVLLVVLVLMIWVAAIALFFNRWGKIRMLEPYQPKFQQAHRQSCPMAVDPAINAQRMSFSKFNVNCLGDPSLYNTLPSPRPPFRPRQNSVFVGSPTMAFMNPPRRAKSAMDIQHLVLGEFSPSGSLSGCSSLLPMSITNKDLVSPRERRPSIAVAPVVQNRHRPSICRDTSCHLPLTSYRRRPSCFTDRPPLLFNRHSRLLSIDHEGGRPDRRTSIQIERSPTSRNRPSFSLDKPMCWDRRPSVTVEPPVETEEEVIVDVEEIKPKLALLKQTTIHFDPLHQPHVVFKKESTSLDNDRRDLNDVRVKRETCSIDNSCIRYDRRGSSGVDCPSPRRGSSSCDDRYERRPSFTLEKPSVSQVLKRLSSSLDQSKSVKWDETQPFITPLCPSIELVPMEAEGDSERVTDV